MATRDNAGNTQNVNKVYGPIAASAKSKSKPKSIDDLDIQMSTLAMVSEEKKYTKDDPNVYKGTYKGQTYTYHKGKFSK